MATQSALYRAPFAPGGPNAIDAALAQRLLAVALANGGDYADLFFEYRAAGGLVFDEGILKSASRGVVDGARGARAEGRRDRLRLRRAARLGRDEPRGGDRGADRERRRIEGARSSPGSVELPRRYELEPVTLDVPGHREARSCSSARRRRPTPTTRTSEGRGEPRRGDPRDPRRHERRQAWRATRSPSCASASASSPRRTASGRRARAAAAGGRASATSRARAPSGTRARPRGRPSTMLDAQEAPAGQMEVVLAPGDSGILLHEAVGHGLEADFNRKGTSNYSGKIGEPVASELCTVVDDATLAPEPRHHQRRRRGQRAAQRACSSRRASSSGYMHDRLSAEHFKLTPSGNGRRESFASAPMPRMTNTILLAGPARSRGDPQERQARRLREASSAAGRSTSPTATSSSR